jgi:hypothetical protein
MKRTLVILFAALLVGALLWWRHHRQPAPPLEPTPAERVATGLVETVSAPAAASVAPGQPVLLGDKLLRGYGEPGSQPESDLTLMARLIDNFHLVGKAAANRPLSANEDWADALRGRNPTHERFLSDSHRALNTNHQLVDRWGTPLFFHALGGGRFELRSAGPDRQLWTADDLHRNADGSFRRGTNLNPASLFPRPKP